MNQPWLEKSAFPRPTKIRLRAISGAPVPYLGGLPAPKRGKRFYGCSSPLGGKSTENCTGAGTHYTLRHKKRGGLAIWYQELYTKSSTRDFHSLLRTGRAIGSYKVTHSFSNSPSPLFLASTLPNIDRPKPSWNATAPPTLISSPLKTRIGTVQAPLSLSVGLFSAYALRLCNYATHGPM